MKRETLSVELVLEEHGSRLVFICDSEKESDSLSKFLLRRISNHVMTVKDKNDDKWFVVAHLCQQFK